MPLLRLDKIIADAGFATRSEAAALIRRGCVTADGRRAASGTERFDPEISVIIVNGERIIYKKHIYIMMNKPAGFVSATEDRRERVVTELVDENYRRRGLFPVGRLDKDAEGLLLLTDDGNFAHNITSPSKSVPKRYFAKICGVINAEDINAFANGLTLGDGTVCAPAELEPAPDGGAFVTLSEGKYHQVKRMLAAIGKPVKYLKRISIGGLELDESLAPGGYRDLNKKEIDSIFDNR